MYFLRREPDSLSVTILACRMKLIRCPCGALKKFSLQKYL
jgi:hypothetical protein